MPKVLGLVGVLPLFLGLSWLAWNLTQESLTILREWEAVRATVVDDSGEAVVRLRVQGRGGEREVDVPWTGDLEAFGKGESFAAYANPADEREVRPAGAGAMWGGPGVVGFFALAMGGILAFLLRVKPLPMLVPDSFMEEVGAAPARARFRPVKVETLVLKRPAALWKAGLFWGGVFGVVAAASLLAPGEGDVAVRVVAAVGALIGAALVLRRGARSRLYEVRCERERLVIRDHAGESEVLLRRVEMVMREQGAFVLLDGKGATVARLEADLEPAEALKSLLRRVHAHRQERD
ncbi:MAG: hypothetical protein KJZ79_00035 [Bryobacteraceae bacterium]|nr:hypothetical protein [Bryobacteraceae bacterium]